MSDKEFVFDTIPSQSGSSKIIVIPPKFFVATGYKKNSKKQIRVTLTLIILVALGSLALAQEEKETTGLGSLITQNKLTNTRITELQKQFTADIIDVREALTAKIDGLFNRVIVAVIAVQLFVLSTSKAIGGIFKYVRGRKQLKAVNKNNQLIEQLIPLLVTLQTIQAVKESQAQEPKKTKPRFNPANVIIAGVIAILTLLTLQKFGVIG